MENQFQNLLKHMKSISTLSTLHMLRTWITVTTAELNSAIWDQIPVRVVHVHCQRCFKLTKQRKEVSSEVQWGSRSQAQRNEPHSGTGESWLSSFPLQGSCSSLSPISKWSWVSSAELYSPQRLRKILVEKTCENRTAGSIQAPGPPGRTQGWAHSGLHGCPWGSWS